MEGGGNAAKAGLKAGDQVLYTSSFFGDELWPADKLGFTKTAIQAKPDSVYFVVSRSSSHYCFFTFFGCKSLMHNVGDDSLENGRHRSELCGRTLMTFFQY